MHSDILKPIKPYLKKKYGIISELALKNNMKPERAWNLFRCKQGIRHSDLPFINDCFEKAMIIKTMEDEYRQRGQNF